MGSLATISFVFIGCSWLVMTSSFVVIGCGVFLLSATLHRKRPKAKKRLGSVVQRADNVIQRINRYSVNKGLRKV